jgi:hypothetical protein
LRVESVVEEKGADSGFQINDELQEGRHKRHYDYKNGLVTLSGQP